jgi:tRNA(Ile)-lysidine synthase TilS/MesJ
MKSVSEEQGVTTLRPMLSIYKKDILQFADSSDIPHLCDSTPAWSRRGQMRDNLIPGIQTFDKNILPGLEQYIKHTIFLEKQWENSFNSWLKNIKTIDSNLNVPRDTFFETNNSVNFWIKLWYNCNISQDRPSNKSFENLIEMTKKPVTNGSRVCTVNSKFAVKIYNDRLIISQN